MNNRYKPQGWRNDNHRHYLAAKYGSAGKTQPHKYYAFFDKSPEDNVPKDDGGIFGPRFKNDSHHTNHRINDSERKNRVWEDRINTQVDKGELKPEAIDEYRELFKNLQRQFVNKEITRDQFEQELQSKGDWIIQRHQKTLDIWGPIHGTAKIPKQEVKQNG